MNSIGQKKLKDSIGFGFKYNIIYALIFFVISNGISFFIFSQKGGEEALGAVVFFFFLIPGSAILSGIVNGFLLMKKGFIKASKTNFVIAGVAFIVGSTCYLSLFLG